jgi:tetratricopeptide (TPR) repeat protein
MKKTTALFTLAVMALMAGLSRPARAAGPRRVVTLLPPANTWSAPPQGEQAKGPQWKSREEYDAYTAMANEKDPNKKIALADAFLQKYASSDFKFGAYGIEMQAYQALNEPSKAMSAAKKVLESNPDTGTALQALALLNYVFPFVFKPTDADATAQLEQAAGYGKQALDELAKLQKPEKVSEDQFSTYVKQQRAIANGAVGFVALQKKDYAGAITAFKSAVEDNPSDVYSFYRLGLAYLYSDPPDDSNAIWNLARAVALAKAASNAQAADFEKFLRQVYINYHGNDSGLSDIMTQAASSPTPPAGFTVAQIEPPKPTGNQIVDAFNQLTFPLRLGGPKAQEAWSSMKGQPLALGGSVDSVSPGTDPNTFSVKIDILDSSKAADGVFDVELLDSTQPNVQYLKKGDLVAFKGTISQYTPTPSLYLTVTGEITTDLPEKPEGKGKTTPTHHHATKK